MAAKLNGLLMFLLVLVFQEMVIMRGEAETCEAKSKLFNGACFSTKNCGSICEKEGFSGGKCKFFKCVCFKDCNINGGGGTPAQGPPADAPPAEGPPSDDPPSDGPPGEGPPADGPPSEEQPGEGPPEGGEVPPVY
ncbi:hypothetical protein DH2020_033098 [Rehmannia glutinosa]|uniref:Knottins-like domain-containing protein n=1 Tax=Rehmannia glutinosa TaxID=99300 RepID=A0ABR0VD94_REHGL